MGLATSVQRSAHGAIALLHTRLALLSVETQALGVAAAQALARGALAALLLLVALGCAVAAMALAVAPQYRVALLGGLALLLVLAAAGLLRSAQRQWQALGRPFGASLDELAEDAAALRPREPAP